MSKTLWHDGHQAMSIIMCWFLSALLKKTNLFQERKGPKLESEELSLRGNEQKYLGSLNQKNFLNLWS